MANVPTKVELFRAGNKTTPKMEHFVADEIVIESRGGVDWVKGPRQGGASTKEAPIGLRGTWYRLPAGTMYDDARFLVWNDYDDHWVWEPAQDMLLADYLAALMALNSEFIRV